MTTNVTRNPIKQWINTTNFELEKINICSHSDLRKKTTIPNKKTLRKIMKISELLPKQNLGEEGIFKLDYGKSLRLESGCIKIIDNKYMWYFFHKCSRGKNPYSFMLALSKAREIGEILKNHNYRHIDVLKQDLFNISKRAIVIKRTLIQISSKLGPVVDIIDSYIPTHRQSDYVRRSDNLDLEDKKVTIGTLASYPEKKQREIAHEIMKLICQSGLRISFDSFQIDKITGKLILIDSSPYYYSMISPFSRTFVMPGEDEFPPAPYDWPLEVIQGSAKTKETCTATSLQAFLDNIPKKLPFFIEVAKSYKKSFEDLIKRKKT